MQMQFADGEGTRSNLKQPVISIQMAELWQRSFLMRYLLVWQSHSTAPFWLNRLSGYPTCESRRCCKKLRNARISVNSGSAIWQPVRMRMLFPNHKPKLRDETKSSAPLSGFRANRRRYWSLHGISETEAKDDTLERIRIAGRRSMRADGSCQPQSPASIGMIWAQSLLQMFGG